MTTADLQAAERAYQRARRADRQGASVKRKAAVRAALEAGWTHRAVAEAMGKSTGWVGQLLTVKAPTVTLSDHIRAQCDAEEARLGGPSIATRHDREIAARHEAISPQVIASTTAPQQDRSKAIDRFRKAQT